MQFVKPAPPLLPACTPQTEAQLPNLSVAPASPGLSVSQQGSLGLGMLPQQELRQTDRCSCQQVRDFQITVRSVGATNVRSNLKIFHWVILMGAIFIFWFSWTIGYEEYWNTLLDKLDLLVAFVLVFLFYVILINVVKQFRATGLWKIVKNCRKTIWKIHHFIWKSVLKLGIAGRIDIEDIVNEFLANLCCTDFELENQEELIRTSLTAKIDTLEHDSKHSVTTVNTGSIFERYGKPLSASTSDTHLKSDYDVMFSFDITDLPLKVEYVGDEYVYLIATSDQCELVRKLQETRTDAKLSASRARQYLQGILRKDCSTEMFQKASLI